MDVLVGCPVRSRSWIMPTWFDHVEASAARAGLAIRYVFVTDPTDETVPIILDRAGERADVVFVDESSHPYLDGDRSDVGATAYRWSLEERVQHMVMLRNYLLGLVAAGGPDVFVSIDSDVLVAPDTLGDLVESLSRFAAVGGGTWMDARDPRIQSCGWIEGIDGFARKHMEGPLVIPMEVIMAVKAMSPAAYAVPYEYNRNGEDIGWSLACARAGVRLGWDNRHPSKHVMSRAQLGVIDERCGF